MVKITISEEFNGKTFEIEQIIDGEVLCDAVDPKEMIWRTYSEMAEEMVMSFMADMENTNED